MKTFITKSVVVAVAAAVVMPLLGQRVSGQDAAKPAGIVAVLDVAKVFKEDRQFEARMNAIKSEADTLKKTLQGDQKSLQSDAQQLAQYEIGSMERNQLEASLEQKQAALRTRARQAEAELLNREAKIYYETYQKMQSIVAELATQNGISLVLRFDSTEINSTNRAEVVKGVNRSVVFHRKLDLTSLVSGQMSPGTAMKPATNQTR